MESVFILCSLKLLGGHKSPGWTHLVFQDFLDRSFSSVKENSLKDPRCFPPPAFFLALLLIFFFSFKAIHFFRAIKQIVFVSYFLIKFGFHYRIYNQNYQSFTSQIIYFFIHKYHENRIFLFYLLFSECFTPF